MTGVQTCALPILESRKKPAENKQTAKAVCYLSRYSYSTVYKKSKKHMKFRDIDEAILDGVKEKLLEGFRDEEEFGYMAGYEPWEKLIFDR